MHPCGKQHDDLGVGEDHAGVVDRRRPAALFEQQTQRGYLDVKPDGKHLNETSCARGTSVIQVEASDLSLIV
jgi:hypothetical protein